MRPSPRPLDRERILETAIAIADASGLSAVSLRRVGAALDAGPMRLYNFVSTKDDLLEMMVDTIYGEMVAEGPYDGDWRKTLRTVAQRTRAAIVRHPWFVELLVGKTHVGPNALAHHEACLAALRATSKFTGLDSVLYAMNTLNAYVVGAMRTDALAPSQRRHGRAASAYLARMLGSGNYPNLAVAFNNPVSFRTDNAFEHGVECILDGVAAAHA